MFGLAALIMYLHLHNKLFISILMHMIFRIVFNDMNCEIIDSINMGGSDKNCDGVAFGSIIYHLRVYAFTSHYLTLRLFQ